MKYNSKPWRRPIAQQGFIGLDDGGTSGRLKRRASNLEGHSSHDKETERSMSCLSAQEIFLPPGCSARAAVLFPLSGPGNRRARELHP